MNFKNKKIAWLILAILFLSGIFAWIEVYNLNKPGLLEITFFDIGQGDAIFIETPEKEQILIDGGPSSLILEKLAQEIPFYDKTIDLIILTHPEHDHIRGLLDVLERYEVENILWTGVVRDTNEWQQWIRMLEKEEAEIEIAEKGQRIVISENPFIFISILHPFESLEGQEFERANNTSIVAQLIFNDITFLFTGDITKKIELELVEQNGNLKSEILKIGHHGSKTSSSLEFLELVLSKIGIIQCGRENNYGHPHLEVLSRLEEFGIEVLRTDEKGDIKIVSDGTSYKVNLGN